MYGDDQLGHDEHGDDVGEGSGRAGRDRARFGGCGCDSSSIAIDKSVDKPTVVAGTLVTYTIKVSNTGDATL